MAEPGLDCGADSKAGLSYSLPPPFPGMLTLNENGKHLLWRITFYPRLRFLSFVLKSAFWLEPVPRYLVLQHVITLSSHCYSVTLSNFLIFLKHILPLSVGMSYDLAISKGLYIAYKKKGRLIWSLEC